MCNGKKLFELYPAVYIINKYLKKYLKYFKFKYLKQRNHVNILCIKYVNI